MQTLRLSPQTTVFGNGFGAFVALELALRHGASFGRLCVADVVAAFPEPARVPFRTMATRVRERGMQAVLDIAIGRMFPPAFQERFPEIVALRKRRLAGVDAECFARACLALAELDLRSGLTRIHNPTLVLCGSLDQTTPPALARDVARAIPQAMFAEIADSGHCPMLEQPDSLVSAMLTFTGPEELQSAILIHCMTSTTRSAALDTFAPDSPFRATTPGVDPPMEIWQWQFRVTRPTLAAPANAAGPLPLSVEASSRWNSRPPDRACEVRMKMVSAVVRRQ